MAYTVDQYPTWKETEAKNYVQGSRVSWKDENGITWGFIANSVYKDGKVNGVVVTPSRYSGWSYDSKFGFAWSSTETYTVGQRVYYDIGDPKKGTSVEFLYIASTRYFGGHGKPNEEVDDDGIRTWYPVFSQVRLGTRSQFTLFPIKKRFELTSNYAVTGGLNGQGISSAESIGVVASNITSAEAYVKHYGKWFDESADFKTGGHPEDVNSVFEGSPYDENVYSFYTLKEVNDKNGKRKIKVPRKKGIHRAQLAKIKYNEAKQEDKDGIYIMYSTADRQWYHTTYGGGVNDNGETISGGNNTKLFPFYFQETSMEQYNSNPFYEYGFSCEMWPSLNEDTGYELIPHNCRNLPTGTSSYNSSVAEKFPNIIVNTSGSSFDNGGFLGVTGGDKTTGHEQEPTSEEACKVPLYIELNSMAFWNRTITIRLLVSDSTYSWKKDSNGYEYADYQPIKYRFENIDVEISDSSFIGEADPNDTYKKYKWMVKDGKVELDFSSYRKPRTATAIRFTTVIFK